MTPRPWPLLAVVFASLVAIAGLPAASAETPVPAFTITDIDGNVLSSAGLRGQVVVLDFSAIWCPPCSAVEDAFVEMYPSYAGRGVVFLSVYLPPLNEPENLEQRRAEKGIQWHMAPDNDGLHVRYGVYGLPRVFVIDRNGFLVHDWTSALGLPPTPESVKAEIGPAIDRALQGGASLLDVTALSIPALLIVAAFLSLFSPCSFPVLPAFMAYYLNLDAKGAKVSTKVAAARGFVASLGIVAVYGAIALVLFAAGIAAQMTVVFISPIVGLLLILFGILTLLPLQYHFLTRPFVALKRTIAAKLGGRWTPGMGAKLFAFGAGYGAAGFACVAPPFIGAVLNASALGAPQQGMVGLLIYVGIVIALMVAITIALHLAGDRALQKVRAWSAAMKYVTAAAFLVAGAYLILFFYLAYRG